MKFTWEASDIVCGRIICKPNPRKGLFTPCGWTAKHTYKIGWLAGGNPMQVVDFKLKIEDRIKVRQDYCLIAMTDGMIGNPHTKQELADQLNTYELSPMPHEWFLATVDYLRDLNERGNG